MAIQKDPEIVIGHLHKYAQEYKSLDPESRKRFYYEVREAYNQEKPGGVYDSKKSPARVAMTIFLNRTCYNGLYRVNSKGNFNVPFGRYTNPKVCDATNLRKVSEALQKAEITNGDFEVIDGRVNKNSFVYFDPPYKPVSQTSSFTAYSKKCFDDTEQKRLASLYGKMASKANVFLMLSNSTPKPNIFKELYKGFQVKTISANRHINCISAKRGKVKEILVMNYPTSGFRVRPTKRPKDIHP